MALKNLNKPIPRIEGADKVSGRTRYAADIPIPASLAAKILRTSLPHARIVGIDASKAESCPACARSSPVLTSPASWSACA
jgi:CO/xanthine dehydrogenase Mo-binding subunit